MTTAQRISEEAQSVHGRVMLVNLSISQWTARQVDKKAAREVQQNHNMTSTKGAYYKSLVEGSSLDAIKTLVSQARAEHYRRTLPWSDNGMRVLSNLGYFDYMQAMGEYETQFRQLVGKFIGDYPNLRQAAQVSLGTLFDIGEYPALSEIGTKFGFRVSVLPLPKGDDFRCDLGTEEVDRLRGEIEASTRAAVQHSLQDAFDRVAKVAEDFMLRLRDDKTVFRDSLIEKARDLADLLPSLNITNDPRLADYTERLRTRLGGVNPDTLRTDPLARRQAYNEALNMHKDLMDFFGGKLA